MLLYKDRVVQTQSREIFSTFDPANVNLQGTGLNSPFESTQEPIKSIYKDPFKIIGDEIPYNIQIYPSYNHKAPPRVIGNKDYLIVTDPGDPTPYTDYLVLDKNTLKEAISGMQASAAPSNPFKSDSESHTPTNDEETSESSSNNENGSNESSSNNENGSNEGDEGNEGEESSSSKLASLSDNETAKQLLKYRKLIEQDSNKNFKSSNKLFPSFIQIANINSANTPVNNLYSMIQNHEPTSKVSGSTLLGGLRDISRTSNTIPNQQGQDRLTSHTSQSSSLSPGVANLSPEERIHVVDRIYNILGPNYDKTGITKEYIDKNLDKLLLEYQIIWANKQKGRIFLQTSSSTRTDTSVIKTLLKDKSPSSIDDFGMQLNTILSDLKKGKSFKKIQKSQKDSESEKTKILIEFENNSNEPTKNQNDKIKPEKNLMEELRAKKNELEPKSDLEINSIPTVVANQVSNDTNSLTEKDEISEKTDTNEVNDEGLLADTDPVVTIKPPPVMGPLVTNEVRSMFDVQEGRGSLAFNQNGTWDGINVWQTIAWSDTCK